MGAREEQVRSDVLDLLAKAMSELEADQAVGYVVLSYDRTPTVDQVSSTMVFGPFDTELEAVEFAVEHHTGVNRGLAPDDPEGWDTKVKPLVKAD